VAVMMLAGWLFASSAGAIPLDGLDSGRAWKLKGIDFAGNEKISADDLLGVMTTRERPWYRFWSDRPVFDPVTFGTDLERLERLYESRGYYGTTVSNDLEVDDAEGLITAHISVHEVVPAVISEIDVQVSKDGADQKEPPFPKELPVKRGQVFRESDYQQAEQVLRTAFLENGYAFVKTERHAEVDLDDRQVRIRYVVHPGPLAVFGKTGVSGVTTVDPQLITRELTYREGESYALSKVVETRDKLLALDLFGTVRVGPADPQTPNSVVPMSIEVTEKSHREIKVSAGYGTEDQFRTQLEWRNLNWLGGGRRLSLLTKYSGIETSGSINFTQPHFFSPTTQAIVNFAHNQEKEQTYDLQASRFRPRLEHQFSKTLSAFIGYRLEYDQLSDVADATVQELGGIEKKGLLSGPTLGLLWNTTDDLLNPKRGNIVSFTFDNAGWGGKYKFYKFTTEGKKFLEIGWETVFASRLKLGLGDAIGAEKNLPLFERFYSGGDKSVRGYGRRRLGPLSASDDPLGGRSLLEGSLELRRPIWKELNGAIFVDFGQVSRRAFDVPVDNLQFSRGFGLSYSTPIGPIRIDVGFPFNPPRGDRAWQIHFSIGGAF
jgi:outer membrane protein assembly complex protein YaeT